MMAFLLDLFGLTLAGMGLVLLWRHHAHRFQSSWRPAPGRQDWPLPQEPIWSRQRVPAVKTQGALPELRDYRLEGLLGEGGMATVYRGRCQVTDQMVAVKVVKPEFSHLTEFAERFQREIDNSQALSHPNLVRVLGSGNQGGHLFMAMEWVDGSTLDDLVRPGKPLELGEFRFLAAQMLEGLAYAHARQMYHRDIKAANYILSREGVCKLLDFGLALAEGQTRFTADGFCMGTPDYMAPEVLLKGAYGAASDQYALGVLFFLMLTGQLPFQASDPMKVGVMHVKQPVPDLGFLRPDIPAGWQAMVKRMLEKDPARRFPDLSQILALL